MAVIHARLNEPIHTSGVTGAQWLRRIFDHFRDNRMKQYWSGGTIVKLCTEPTYQPFTEIIPLKKMARNEQFPTAWIGLGFRGLIAAVIPATEALQRCESQQHAHKQEPPARATRHPRVARGWLVPCGWSAGYLTVAILLRLGPFVEKDDDGNFSLTAWGKTVGRFVLCNHDYLAHSLSHAVASLAWKGQKGQGRASPPVLQGSSQLRLPKPGRASTGRSWGRGAGQRRRRRRGRGENNKQKREKRKRRIKRKKRKRR